MATPFMVTMVETRKAIGFKADATPDPKVVVACSHRSPSSAYVAPLEGDDRGTHYEISPRLLALLLNVRPEDIDEHYVGAIFKLEAAATSKEEDAQYR